MQHKTTKPVGSATPPPKFTPSTFYPPDFCGNKDLELEAYQHSDPEIAELVTLSSRGGGLSFRWSLTPEGARRMAQMLCDAASEADRMAQDFAAAQAAA